MYNRAMKKIVSMEDITIIHQNKHVDPDAKKQSHLRRHSPIVFCFAYRFNMFKYFIAGVPKCQDFGHVKLVAEKLRQTLPTFSYKVIVKTEEEYRVCNYYDEYSIIYASMWYTVILLPNHIIIIYKL